ncbi:TRAP transporter large permease [Microbulbifer sp. S227A]|uniref:TRAP transporter large permease n=1 Tax=Microbulbifer sp. S227A TaxID=3415131 RepID=UPI003C7BCFBC
MTLAIIGIALVLILSVIGVPLAFATLFVGIAGISYIRGFEAAMGITGQWIMESSMNYGLSVVPLFILMGAFIHRSGISEELYDAAYAWLGHFRGGVAMSTVFACAGFAAVCGSSLATAATMGRVAMPPMRKFGYDDGLSTGTIAAGGTLGIMIPPSVPMVIYAIIVSADIGALFIAGILPGLLLVSLFLIAIAIRVRLRPDLGPAGERLPLRTRFRKSLGVYPVVGLFMIVLGGIYSGIFTPTESAAVGAVGAYLFALARGYMKTRAELMGVLGETVRTTAMIFAILFCGLVMAQFVNLTGLPFELVDLVTGENAAISATALIIGICIICMIMGMIFEALGILLLVVPVFLPSLEALGVDMIWFGIIVILVVELGLITPPIGMNVFTVKAVVPDVPLTRIFAGVTPFILAMLIGLVMLFWFPAIAVWLPDLMR